MINLLKNEKYLNNLKEYSNFQLDWNKLKNKSIMISGATGLIGRYLIDLLMYKNINCSLNCHIIALGRNKNKAQNFFGGGVDYFKTPYFEFIEQDVSKEIQYDKNVDYIIHAASNTYPIQYATNPIETITTNVFGTYNLLSFGEKKNISKFIFVSSFEVYGTVENKKEITEQDFGIVNCTIPRSCYPESKRVSESLSIAFSTQKNIDISIVRLSRVFGPTMDLQSSLATAQFIKNALNNEDIVLKSDGNQLYSYNYVGDAVTSILVCLLNGKNQEAYNVADENFNILLKDFAANAAKSCNKKVIFDLPEEIESKGFSNLTMTILNNSKIKDIGWYALSNIQHRIDETIAILKES